MALCNQPEAFAWTLLVTSHATCTTTLPLEVFTQRNFVADFIQLKLNFISKKTKKRFLSHLLGT